MANFDTLKAQIAAKIHDNTEQEITAQDVRDCFDDTIDAINAAKEDEGAIVPAQWGGITGDLADQTDLKNALDAKQNTISDLATIQSGAAAGATAVQPGDLATVATTGDYDDLLNKPTIPPGVVVDQTYDATSANAQSGVAMAGALAGKQDTISNLATIEAGAAAGATAVQPGALAAVATSGSYNDLLNKPTIPAAPGTLDTTATTAQATSASEALSGSVVLHKISKTGDYGDLLNKPTIPAAQVNSDWNAGSGVAQILNKPTIPTVPTISTDVEADKASDLKTASPKAVYSFVGNPIVSMTVPTPNDGTVIFNHRNGDTTILDLNHTHPAYLKYQLCADEAEYQAIQNKESDKLYGIPEV